MPNLVTAQNHCNNDLAKLISTLLLNNIYNINFISNTKKNYCMNLKHEQLELQEHLLGYFLNLLIDRFALFFKNHLYSIRKQTYSSKKFAQKRKPVLIILGSRFVYFFLKKVPYLFVSDKCQDACALLLSKFMSRQDLQKKVLPEFFDQIFEHMKESAKSGDKFKLLGTLKCIASIYKNGKREDLLCYTLPTLKNIVELNLLSSKLALVRKYNIKILQRIGMAFFKVKIAKWRYERGSRSLLNNVKSAQTASTQRCQAQDEDDEEIPGEIEEIIEQLLSGLKDPDTIVRWSSAKGIGRITNRLSKENADDILQSLLELFNYVEDDSAWHGGCLAIAELGRRGLLLPQQLKSVVPIIIKALIFDKKLGNYSLGRNVRDAACYVCWSMARAFEPDVIEPYVNQIAGALLIVSVFDREVNCRRAASASFQENVGRQGQFPHGIDIIIKCDYHAVGQIHNCFLDLAIYIASFEEYRQQIVDHLMVHKFNHWDHSIRELTAQSFFKLTPLCPDYMAFEVVPSLIKQSSSIDLNTRHGALLSLGQLIHALSELVNLEPEKLLNKYFNEEFTSKLRHVLSQIFDEKYFRGSGGEYMRPAVCFFVKKFSLCKQMHKQFQLDDQFIGQCEHFLVQCIEQNKESVQLSAAETLPVYCDLPPYHHSEPKLVEAFIKNLRQTSKDYVRSGYCFALGHLPPFFLAKNDNFRKITSTLIVASKCVSGAIDDQTGALPPKSVPKSIEAESTWVQARRDAIKSLTFLFKSVNSAEDVKKYNLNESDFGEVFQCFLAGLEDYSNDSKGDTGSKVREASMEALEFFLSLSTRLNLALAKDHSLIETVLSGLMQQAVERIDRTRSIAAKTFCTILFNPELNIPENTVAKLRQVFVKEECDAIDWNLAYVTMPMFAKFLNSKQFQTNLLIGFVYSIGSLTESVVKSATSSFIKQVKQVEEESAQDFRDLVEKLLALCKVHLKVDRLSSSLIKTVDLLVQNDFFANGVLNADKNYPLEFVELFLENVKVTKDMQRLTSYTDFFCDMLQFDDEKVRKNCLTRLMIQLCHQYSRIRKVTASKLFEALINLPDLFQSDDDNSECICLLTETDWDQPINEVRSIRNRLCELTGTPKPVVKSNPLIFFSNDRCKFDTFFILYTRIKKKRKKQIFDLKKKIYFTIRKS
ncbi:tubulin-specific chaperone D [Brachionus plicatilis]|uniref:Tubulin-specific chaperone D n=1 Tax=Brachionus plicatilis TaxID=10195 RepID=A0A3M7PJS6_BRAPC|nr:tubulin-specific chaperone D [Brachionus plicatilis]